MKTIYKTVLVLTTLLFYNLLCAQTFTLAPVSNPFGINPNPSDGVFQPTFVDIDYDGDQDLLMGRSNSNHRVLELYKNLGTSTLPNFAPPVILINATISNPPYNNWEFIPTFGDVDGDGDFDLFVGRGSYTGGDFEYYENTGSATNPSFSINPTDLYFLPDGQSPAFVDFDYDGDLDLLIGEIGQNSSGVQWYENTGSPTVFNIVFNSNLANIAVTSIAHITVGDLDLDGNFDIVLSGNSTNLSYFLGNGAGSFSSNGVLISNTEAHQFPALVDIDGDGDLDLFIGMENQFQFYENYDPDNVASQIDNSLDNENILSIFPNPVKNVLNLKNDDVKSYQIVNMLGKKIQSGNRVLENKINTSNIKNGIYLLKITNSKSISYTIKFVVEK